MADLTEALTLIALTAATLEYAILVRHRVERRDVESERMTGNVVLDIGH